MEGIDRTNESTTALTRPATGAPPADDVATAALATVRDVTSELVRLVRETAAQATDGWSLVSVVRPLVPEIEHVFSERDALDTEVGELRKDLADADDRIRELEAQLAAREAGWTAERLVLETEASREREQARMLSEDLERRRKELDLMSARERRLREQMETAAARAHADREETLRLAREMVQSAEEARLAIVDEVERLRGSLATEQAHLVEIQHERTRATQGAAEREAELARARSTLEQLEASRASAAADLARARAKLVQTESELLAAQHEYQLAQVQIDKLCSAHDDLIEDRAQLAAKLHDAKERESRLRLRITGLEERIQTVLSEGAAVPASPAPAVEAAVESATSALALELSRAEERARGLESELAKAKAAASAAGTRVEMLQAEVRAAAQARLAATAEVDALRGTVATLEQAAHAARAAVAEASEPFPHTTDDVTTAPPSEEIALPTAAPDDAPAPVDTGESPAPDETHAAPDAPEPLTVADETAGVDEPAAADEPAVEDAVVAAPQPQSAPVPTPQIVVVPAAEAEPEPSWDEESAAGLAEAVAAEPDTAAAPDAESLRAAECASLADEAPSSIEVGPAGHVAGAGGAVVVLDAGPWEAPEGLTAHHVMPGPDVCDRVRELAPVSCVVNLAAPGALAAAAALRSAKITTPLWACAVGAGEPQGLALGAVDVIPRPVDPETVRTQLEARAPQGASVITVSSEGSTLIPLRQGLLQAGMAVRTAWNRQQAAELAGGVHPDVVVLDLASDAAGLADFAALLTRREDAPLIVLVPGAPQHLDEFGAALAGAAGAGVPAERDEMLRTAAR